MYFQICLHCFALNPNPEGKKQDPDEECAHQRFPKIARKTYEELTRLRIFLLAHRFARCYYTKLTRSVARGPRASQC